MNCNKRSKPTLSEHLNDVRISCKTVRNQLPERRLVVIHDNFIKGSQCCGLVPQSLSRWEECEPMRRIRVFDLRPETWSSRNGSPSVNFTWKGPMSKRRTDEEVTRLLKDFDRDLTKGLTVADICRNHGIDIKHYVVSAAQFSRLQNAEGVQCPM